MTVRSEIYALQHDLLSLGESEMSDHLLCVLAAMEETTLTYSAAMRKIRKKYDSEQVHEFQRVFKDVFEEAIDTGIDNPEGVALTKTLKQLELEVGDA
jgi:hypothetical protein